MYKGFTLIELLAVIIILGALTIITVISINPILKDSKEGLTDIQIDNIEESANLYYVKHGIGVDDYELDNPRYCINVSELIESGYIDSDEVTNPKTGEEILGSVKVTYKSNNYIYEYQDGACTNYDKGIICERVTSTELGNVPEGNFVAGDAYNCKVDPDKDPYKFYILTSPEEDSDMVNLIMDQNINSDGTQAGTKAVKQEENSTKYNLVAWNLANTTTGGPETVTQFLYNATKSWTNIPALNYTYNDREYQSIPADNTTAGYISFISDDGVVTITPLTGTPIIIGTTEVPLRARMPIYAYINSVVKGEVSEKTADKSNAYLYENLTTNSTIPYGYWTLSTFSNYNNSAWIVNYYGGINSVAVASVNSIGVRPVISVYKFQME